jgi:hypothetical protein
MGVGQHTLAKHVSLCFTIITIPLSLYQSYEHLANFWRPRLQVQIIRIIWMVVILPSLLHSLKDYLGPSFLP